MEKIEFKDLPDTTTPLSASNLNTLQDNVEEAIDEVQSNLDTANTYSTSEVNTGKIWINNKPIYRKVIIKTNIVSNSQNAVAHNINNIEDLVSVNGYLNAENQKFILPRPSAGSLDYYVELIISNTDVNFKTGGNANFDSAYVVIEYTKTTD